MQQMMPPSFTSICLLDLYGFPEAAILIGNGFFSPCYFNIPSENAQRWQDPMLTRSICLSIPFIYFFSRSSFYKNKCRTIYIITYFSRRR